MTVFVKTEDLIHPCDGYFFIRMTNVMPNKWGVFATQLGLPQPTLLAEYQDDEVFSGHDQAQKALTKMTRYSAATTRHKRPLTTSSRTSKMKPPSTSLRPPFKGGLFLT